MPHAPIEGFSLASAEDHGFSPSVIFRATVATQRLAASYTVDDFFEFLERQMIDGVLPQKVTLAPKQLMDLQASLRAETGALQFSPAATEHLASKGPGYVGSFMGVDIFVATV